MPTKITATSAAVAVDTASAIPEVSEDQSLQPSAKETSMEDDLLARNCLIPSMGLIPLFEALKKT